MVFQQDNLQDMPMGLQMLHRPEYQGSLLPSTWGGIQQRAQQCEETHLQGEADPEWATKSKRAKSQTS